MAASPAAASVSQYDTASPAARSFGVPGLLVTKRLRMEGFIVMDFYDRRDAVLAELAGWLQSGALVATEDVMDGLDQAPQGLVGLLAGDNVGKRMVHVADPGVTVLRSLRGTSAAATRPRAPAVRRGARVDEWGSLLRSCGREATEGSNPSLSAS